MKLNLINTVGDQDSGVKIKHRASVDGSWNEESGKIVYKKIKIRKIRQKLSEKPTGNQTNQIFDELLSHLEANNGCD